MAHYPSTGPAVRALEWYGDLLPLLESDPHRYPCLLESVAHGSGHARYDILFAFPGQRLILDSGGRLHGPARGPGFLGALDEWWQRESAFSGTGSGLPFHGGWFLFLGYELAGEIEPVLRLPGSPDALPTAFAIRIPAAIVRDHRERRSWLVAERGQEELLDLLAADLQMARAGTVADGTRPGPLTVTEEPAGRYLRAVERARRYVIDGDIFQANLSRIWSGGLEQGVNAASLYRSLRRNNAAPFAGLALLEDSAIVSSSPERLVAVRDSVVQTRPIAGTRPRDSRRDLDDAYSSELLAHPKERAEHVMLIDLERNDLGRVCRPGSIEVNELMVLESFAHVHHIVSNVRGRLRAEVTPGEVIRAVFPGGTITGCPKVRCMEIIAELEGSGRGAYTGSMGYLNRDGSMDLNILIRTMVVDGGRISFRAGAGIVADSVPQRELEETRAKARGMLLALEGP